MTYLIDDPLTVEDLEKDAENESIEELTDREDNPPKVIDEDTDGPVAGTPGHPGIDEDTG